MRLRIHGRSKNGLKFAMGQSTGSRAPRARSLGRNRRCCAEDLGIVGKQRVGMRWFVGLAMVISWLQPAPALAGSSCERPEPKVRYSSQRIEVSLTLDVSACKWWKGSAIDLEGVMEQGVAGQGIAAFKSCGVTLISTKQRVDPVRVSKCTLRLRLKHLPIEVDTYSGSFAYPWRHGRRTVDFGYICFSTPLSAECREN